MASPRLKIDAPYARAVAWCRAAPSVQELAKFSPQQRSDMRRIAKIGDAWGLALDAAGVTHRQIKWVAGAAGLGCIVERERRFRALLAFLNRGDGWKAFPALAASLPKLGRAVVAEANRAARDARSRRAAPTLRA